MESVYLSHINLSPGLINRFSQITFECILSTLRKSFVNWSGFHDKYPMYNLGIIVATKMSVTNLEIKGPSISKKLKCVDFAIYLPNKDYDLSEYLDLVFEGIFLSLKKYKVSEAEIIQVRDECKESLSA